MPLHTLAAGGGQIISVTPAKHETNLSPQLATDNNSSKIGLLSFPKVQGLSGFKGWCRSTTSTTPVNPISGYQMVVLQVLKLDECSGYRPSHA